VGFELTISADERPQTNALDRAATETSTRNLSSKKLFMPAEFGRMRNV